MITNYPINYLLEHAPPPPSYHPPWKDCCSVQCVCVECRRTISCGFTRNYSHWCCCGEETLWLLLLLRCWFWYSEGSESVATVVVVVCQLEISFTLVECAPVSFTAPLPCTFYQRRLLLVKDRVPSCRVRECSPCRPLGYKSERNCSSVASLSWDLNRCGNPEFVQSW